MIRQRTQAGVDRARAKGVKFGAGFKLQQKDMKKVWKMRYERNMTYEEIGTIQHSQLSNTNGNSNANEADYR